MPLDAYLSTGARAGCVTISPAMRALVIALLVATGCGGKSQVAGPPAAATVFPAARWVPGQPTYVLAARTMRDAQRAFGDVVDTFGMAIGADRTSLSAMLTRMLAFDPLSADAVADIGVDLDGGIAVFSDGVDPTFAVHLSSPPALHAFIERQRQRGLVTQSATVDGTEVLSAAIGPDVRISWAVDDSWLLVHVALGGDDGTAWFTQSKRPSGSSWVPAWQAAQKLAVKPATLVGTVDVRALGAKLAALVPQALQCVQRFEPVRGAGIVVEGEGNFVGGRVAFDLGSAAPGVTGAVLAPPPGWTAASARAPLAAQWNLDLRTLATWVQPCISAELGGPSLLDVFDHFGVRTGRAFVHSLDPDDKSGTGAVAIDLSHRKYVTQLLDQIPMRSKFEKSRTFGAYQGRHLSVPFVATADYVLDDRVFLVAMGDGVLERATTGTPASPPPVFAIDLLPAGLPVGVWEWLFSTAELPAAKAIAQRLQSWNDIHFGAHVDRDQLVIEAQGNRR